MLEARPRARSRDYVVHERRVFEDLVLEESWGRLAHNDDRAPAVRRVHEAVNGRRYRGDHHAIRRRRTLIGYRKSSLRFSFSFTLMKAGFTTQSANAI